MDQVSETLAQAETLAAYEHNSVYELLREDIIEGRLVANERLKVSALADRSASRFSVLVMIVSSSIVGAALLRRLLRGL